MRAATIFLALAGVAVPAFGCTSAPADPSGTAVMTLDRLITQLKARGFAVDRSDEIEQPFFTVPGQVLKVGSEEVQVYQYASPEKAEAEARLVSPDGSSVGTTKMQWLAPPHFFGSGRVIVLYVGSDAPTLNALTAILGAQFAGR